MNTSRCLLGSLIVTLVLALVSLPAFAQVSISLDIAPPPLMVEDQPACPDDGLIWTPGYWSYDEQQDAYYWVPGSWEQPPQVGLYWTPAYWGWQNNAYVFNEGYWGPSVGFYGGINYGHGYWGNGYGGGRWNNGRFAYNTAANNVAGGHFANTYADRSAVVAQSNRISYNGGQGGVAVQPTPQQQQVAQNRIQPTPQQQAQVQAAAQTRSHQIKANAHPVAANSAAPAPAAGQPQAAQQPAAAQAQTHEQTSPLSGWGSPVKKPVATTENAPAVDKHDAAFTGGDAQAQHKEPVAPQNVAPANPQPATAVNPAKQEEKPHVAEPQVKTEAAAVNPAKLDEKPHVAEQPAPQGHAPQGPAPAVAHTAAPDVHPQAAAPHVDAKPEAKPEVKAPDANPHP